MPAIPFILKVLLERRRLESSCRWTLRLLLAHQQAAISRLRSFACRHSPFYACFYLGLEVRPFKELPVLTKATLMESFDSVITDRDVRLSIRTPLIAAVAR